MRIGPTVSQYFVLSYHIFQIALPSTIYMASIDALIKRTHDTAAVTAIAAIAANADALTDK